MLTDEERQTAYYRHLWMKHELGRRLYWQSMWEKSMHNPSNKAKDSSPMLGDLPYPANPNNTFTPPPAWQGVRGKATPCASEATFSEAELSILTEAQSLVHGPRQDAYGHPVGDFSRTASLANVLLGGKLREDLDARDVALFMVCVKLSREVNQHKRDNLVDAAGYLECLARVERFRKPLDNHA